MRGLKDKRVLITGGAGGIGAATARRFLEEGSRVVVLDRDDAACLCIQRDLPGLHGIISADVSDAQAVHLVFDELDGLMDGLDVLINNAGISIRHPFVDITPQEWRQVMDVNLNGVFYVAQQAARRMLAGGGGVIVDIRGVGAAENGGVSGAREEGAAGAAGAAGGATLRRRGGAGGGGIDAADWRSISMPRVEASMVAARSSA